MTAAAMNTGTAKITPREAMKVAEFHLRRGDNFILFGPPAIGKTELIKQVINSLIWEEDGEPYDLMISHPQLSDPTDYKGMPGFDTDDNGKRWAEFFAFGNLRQMIEATRPLVVFLDDFGQAPKMVQAALQQLVLERNVDGKKISEHVRFVMAANRAQDKAGVDAGTLTTIKTRATLYEVEPTVEDWCRWAISNDIAPECVAFVRFQGLKGLWSRVDPNFKPGYGTDNERSPRTCTRSFLQHMDGIPEGLEIAMHSGNTDGAWAHEFVAFSRTWTSLPNIDMIYADPSTFEAPGLDKPDVLYAITAAIAARATPKLANKFFKLIKKLPADFRTYAVRDAYFRDKAIANCNGFVEWFEENPDIIQG